MDRFQLATGKVSEELKQELKPAEEKNIEQKKAAALDILHQMINVPELRGMISNQTLMNMMNSLSDSAESRPQQNTATFTFSEPNRNQVVVPILPGISIQEAIDALNNLNQVSEEISQRTQRIQTRNPASSFLRIHGPDGNQIIIPLVNILAHAQPTTAGGYRREQEYELVIRLPRSQAELIMGDINNARSAAGIPIARNGV